MELHNPERDPVVVLLRLRYHADSVRNAFEEIRRPAVSGLRNVDQFRVRLFRARRCPRGRRLLAVLRALHSGSGRGSHCAVHTRFAGQMDSAERAIANGSRRLCR